MSKKKKKKKKKSPPKEGPVYRLTAEEATLLGRPRYNGYAIGHGPHGKAKYDRRSYEREHPIDEA